MADDIIQVETEQLSQQQDPQQNDQQNDQQSDPEQQNEQQIEPQIERQIDEQNEQENSQQIEQAIEEQNEQQHEQQNEQQIDQNNQQIDQIVDNQYIDDIDTDVLNANQENVENYTEEVSIENTENVENTEKKENTENTDAINDGIRDEVENEMKPEIEKEIENETANEMENEIVNEIENENNDSLEYIPDNDHLLEEEFGNIPDNELYVDELYQEPPEQNEQDKIVKNIEKSTREISTQTIITAPEIKLGSKTKKRIAAELGYFIPKTSDTFGKKFSSSSLSPIFAAKQMRSSSQKIAKLINEHKAQLKVMFDRYSNGLTNKIKLDGLTRMLKDRGILKKLSLVPEITKAFHKSSFTKDTPDSLTFDEFLQCIIRLANELLSRKKKSKYKTAESRVTLFLAKLHLRPFTNNSNNNNIINNVTNKDDINRKSIAADLSPKVINNMQYDYRLTEQQLDSEFDNYFNTGGFFKDINSSIPTGSIPTGSIPTRSIKTGQSTPKSLLAPVSSPNIYKMKNTNNMTNNYGINSIKPNPLNSKQRESMKRGSYQQMYNQQYQQYPMEYIRQERVLSNQIQNLTEQEQQIVRNIRQRQQSQLRAVQARNSSDPYQLPYNR